MPEDAAPPRSPHLLRAAALVPAGVFAALLLLTWRRWILPFEDTGREVLVPLRLRQGEVLYRDVVCWYGPLPAYLDAAVLALREHLDALIALRVAVALLGVEALRRIGARLAGPLAGAAVASLVVAACFFLPCGGAVPFPYSVAALEGSVLAWWALERALAAGGPGGSAWAAVLAGLAAGTKPELLPAALLAVAPALFLRRPRREAALATGLAALLGLLAWTLPVLLLGAPVLARHGYLVAGNVPAAWGGFYRDVFWGAGGPGAHLGAWGISAAYLGAAYLLARRAPRLVVVPFLLGLAAVVVPRNDELQACLPLALVLAAFELRTPRTWRERPEMPCLALALLVPLARRPFLLDPGRPYSPFTAPLALLLVGLAAARFLGDRRAPLAFAAGLLVAQVADRAAAYRAVPRETVATPRGTLALFPSEARLLAALLERLSADTPPRSFVAGFPEPGLVLFLADRRSPFAHVQFHPGAQDDAARREIADAIDRAPLAAAFVLNRTHPEFGGGVWGIDYDRRLLSALRGRMASAGVLGQHAGPASGCVRADQALYFLPKGP